MNEIEITLPTPLRIYTNNQKKVKIAAETVDDALKRLVETYPALQKHLFQGNELRSYVNIYINDTDVRHHPDGFRAHLEPQDTIFIIPSIAGGLK